MRPGTDEDEHPGSAEQEEKQVWNWTPSSGEGSQAALIKLKRAERIKSSWRCLRGGFVKPPDDEEPPSAK